MFRDNQREWRQSWGTVEQVPSKCGVQGSVISLPLKSLSFCSLRAFVHTILWHSIIIAFSSVKTWVLACWWRRFDWSFARLIAPVVAPPPPSTLAPIKSRTETLWYQLIRVVLETGR